MKAKFFGLTHQHNLILLIKYMTGPSKPCSVHLTLTTIIKLLSLFGEAAVIMLLASQGSLCYFSCTSAKKNESLAAVIASWGAWEDAEAGTLPIPPSELFAPRFHRSAHMAPEHI